MKCVKVFPLQTRVVTPDLGPFMDTGFFLYYILIKGRWLMMSDKNFVEKVTNMEDDFGQWYTDVVKQAELVDYGAVRGTMIIKPYGYALWENIQKVLDGKIKETGHTNV